MIVALRVKGGVAPATVCGWWLHPDNARGQQDRTTIFWWDRPPRDYFAITAL